MDLRFIVYSRKSIYDDLIIRADCVINHKSEVFVDLRKIIKIKMNNRGFHSYTASAYVNLLKSSDLYRKSAVKLLYQLTDSVLSGEENPVIFMKLRIPRKQFLDYNWGERITQMVKEKREIEYAMSWLSTLGGAFSAMGDHFSHCAQIAGKISVQQFKLALRLDDPLLVARCKLYASLSLIQQNKLKIPKEIIPEIYLYAVNNKDEHLKKMCQGIWAKLKYHHYLQKQSRKRMFR